MAQLIYSVLALMLIMFLSMNMQRGIGKDQHEQALNEVTTQLLGVGTEVLEHIGRSHFDGYNWRFGVDTPTRPYCGRLDDTEADSLNSPLGPSSCEALGYTYENCPFIEGFVDFTPSLTRGEFEYNINSIEVGYVDPVTYAASGSPTFAKRVTIEVEYPYMYLGNDPSNTLKLEMDRVFIYGCVTEPNFIPYVPPGSSCPPEPLCSISP